MVIIYYIIFIASLATFVVILIFTILKSIHQQEQHMETQCQTILNYLIAIPKRTIDTWTAYEKFHITTLAQRIFDLRSGPPIMINGVRYEIKDRTVNRDGKSWSEYWIEPFQEQTELFK